MLLGVKSDLASSLRGRLSGVVFDVPHEVVENDAVRGTNIAKAWMQRTTFFMFLPSKRSCPLNKDWLSTPRLPHALKKRQMFPSCRICPVCPRWMPTIVPGQMAFTKSQRASPDCKAAC